MKKTILASIFILFFSSIIIFVLMFHPVNNSRGNSLIVNGKVVSITEGGVKDACFYLEADSCCYYINRGLEKGLNIEDLQSRLLNKEVTINYANYWSLFNVAAKSKHVNQLEYGDSIVFTEW